MDAIRSKDIWFEDGDVVLSITEDGEDHHFRVHRAILTIASPVFRDMFSISQPSGGESLVVSLQGDSVQDLTALLRELYLYREAQIVTLDVTLGILRLSHKYQITGLQKRMKLRLQEDWPLKYSDYLARLTYLGSPENRIPQAVKVIETAQRCEVNELLPTPFYELSCVGSLRCQEIIGGLSDINMARLWFGRLRFEQRLRSFANTDMETQTLMWRCSNVILDEQVDGQDLLSESPMEPTIVEYRKKFRPCPSNFFDENIFCPSTFSTFRTILAERLLDGISGLTVLQQFNCENLTDVCADCKKWFKSVLENKVQELWENIPTDFELPPIDSELYSESQIRPL